MTEKLPRTELDDAPATGEVPAASSPRERIRALQIGVGWFGERAGGLERYFADLLAALEPAGVQSVGLVPGSLAVREMSGGRVSAFAPVEAKTVARRSASARAVAESLRAGHFDLVVSHFALYGASATASLAGRPMVTHFHGPWAAESRAEGDSALRAWVKARLERRVYRGSSQIITLSDSFKETLCRVYGICEDVVSVIPGGVDLARFSPVQSKQAARTALGWPLDRPTIFSVRRLTNRMGLEHLIDAMTTVRKTVPDALCLIAGRGHLEPELSARIRKSGLSEHVRLLGYVAEEQLPLAYRAADLSVVPSVSLEGFGLVVAESLAAGTPAVVTPVGGLPEVVSGLSPALVLEGTTTEALADRLRNILAGKVAVPDALACRRYAEQHFDWRRVANQVRAVYEMALGSVGRGRGPGLN